VHQRHQQLDADRRYWVNGTVHHTYHPPLSASFAWPDLHSQTTSASTPLASRYKQRQVAAVFVCESWIRAKELTDQFDATHTALTSSIRCREGARLVSYSQPGGGDFLNRLPDPALHHSVTASSIFLVQCQRLLGLYISALAPSLDAEASAGATILLDARLGDTAINDTNKSHRHQVGLRCIYNAVRAVTSAASPLGSLRLGDKGDGTPEGAEDARERTKHINAGTVPDMYRDGHPYFCYEYKCYSALSAGNRALGNGSRRLGGAPSQTDGSIVAFGNTEEHLTKEVLGLVGRGSAGQPAMNRRSGDGWVQPHDGAYADALRKGHGVALLVTESSGALAPGTHSLLQLLGRAALRPFALDSTVYGTARSSPRDFYAHHVAAHSAAVTTADALVVLNHGAYLGHRAARRRRPPAAPAPPPAPTATAPRATAPLQPTAAYTHAAPAHEPNGSPTPCDMSTCDVNVRACDVSTCDVNACVCVVAECSGPAAGP
jgi:hypothetical protein